MKSAPGGEPHAWLRNPMPSLWTRALVVDEPTWPLRIPEPPPPARGEPEPAGRLLLRIAEAAELLAISRSSLYQLISAGEVQTMRLGRLGAIDPAVAKLNMDRPPNPHRRADAQ